MGIMGIDILGKDIFCDGRHFRSRHSRTGQFTGPMTAPVRYFDLRNRSALPGSDWKRSLRTFSTVFTLNIDCCTVRQIFPMLKILNERGFGRVYFEYEENCTHDRLLSLNYAFCHIKRLLKTSEPVYRD